MNIFLLIFLLSCNQVFKWKVGSYSWLQTRNHPLCVLVCNQLCSSTQQAPLIKNKTTLCLFSELTFVNMLGIYKCTIDFFDIVSRTKYLSCWPSSLWNAIIALIYAHRILQQLKKSVLHFWHSKRPCKLGKMQLRFFIFSFKLKSRIGSVLLRWFSKGWSNLPPSLMTKLDSLEVTCRKRVLTPTGFFPAFHKLVVSRYPPTPKINKYM